MPITVKDLSYTYMKGTPYEKKALNGVSITVNDGDFLGIVGATGSGKSTFIRHLNGLIKLEAGSINVDGIDLSSKRPDLRLLRRKVGMVFQYPESQLFAETVLKDVMYGPRNMKLTEEECLLRAKEAMELSGLSYERFRDRSPFELSGGERRRAAIAGVIACRPDYLILDEPSAGLDPKGKDEIYSLLLEIKSAAPRTIIVISHDIDEIAEHADRIAVFDDGGLIADFKTRDIGLHTELLRSKGLDIPVTLKILGGLRARGKDIPLTGIKRDEFISFIIDEYNRRQAALRA